MKLSVKDYDLALAIIGEVYSWRTLPEFKEAVFPVLRKAIPADHLSWVTFQLAPSPKLVGFEESEQRYTPELGAISERGINRHPFVQYFLRTGDKSALILSDFLTDRQIESDQDLDAFFRGLDLGYCCMTAPTSISQRSAAALSFAGRSWDFTERDRAMINLLSPHVTQARCNAERVSALLASGAMQHLEEHQQRLAELTPREKEVGEWIALGKTNDEIGILLGASPRTIEKHVHRVLEKLLVENRTSAAILINNARGR